MEQITFEQLPKAVSQLFEKLNTIHNLLLNQNKTSSKTDRLLLSKREVASWLKLSLPTVSKLTFEGQLPAIRLKSGQLRYDQAEVESALKKMKIKTTKDL